MQVKLSSNLERHMALMKSLVNRLDEVFDYVSILGSDVISRMYNVKEIGKIVSDVQWFRECGYVVRVHNGVNYSEHSFNELTEEMLETIYENIIAVGKRKFKKLQELGLSIIDYVKQEEEIIRKAFRTDVDISLEGVSTQDKLQKLVEIQKHGMTLSEELVDVRVTYHEVQVSKVFISSKKEMSQSYIYGSSIIMALAKREDKVQYSYTTLSGLQGVELIDEISDQVKVVVNQAIELLDAEQLEPGEYDVICDPVVAGVIAHEAFGHGVETDMFVKDRAKAPEYMNKQVAAKTVTMVDGVHDVQSCASYFFDDEGMLGGETVIVRDGILESGISDLLSATTLGCKATGNGRRESYERKAYARMSNTYFKSGEDSLEDMIASIDHGYYLETLRGGMEDPKNWGIQVVAHCGREIKDGKFTGKVVSPVYLTGQVTEVLKSITMMSRDFHLTGSGACGKGHKEIVKTTSGGPYIKVRGRLS